MGAAPVEMVWLRPDRATKSRDFSRGTCFPSAANAWDRRRNHSGEGVQELDRPCRRYWWSEHL